MAPPPQPESRCQCREPASSSERREQPGCRCTAVMDAEDLLCTPCRWGKHHGGCFCHLQSLLEYENREIPPRDEDAPEPDLGTARDKGELHDRF
jgi:hypothetical protein